MECYYEPFSKCAIKDALKSFSGQMLTLSALHDISPKSGTAAKYNSFEQQIHAESEGPHCNINIFLLHFHHSLVPISFPPFLYLYFIPLTSINNRYDILFW